MDLLVLRRASASAGPFWVDPSPGRVPIGPSALVVVFCRPSHTNGAMFEAERRPDTTIPLGLVRHRELLTTSSYAPRCVPSILRPDCSSHIATDYLPPILAGQVFRSLAKAFWKRRMQRSPKSGPGRKRAPGAY